MSYYSSQTCFSQESNEKSCSKGPLPQQILEDLESLYRYHKTTTRAQVGEACCGGASMPSSSSSADTESPAESQCCGMNATAIFPTLVALASTVTTSSTTSSSKSRATEPRTKESRTSFTKRRTSRSKPGECPVHFGSSASSSTAKPEGPGFLGQLFALGMETLMDTQEHLFPTSDESVLGMDDDLSRTPIMSSKKQKALHLQNLTHGLKQKKQNGGTTKEDRQRLIQKIRESEERLRSKLNTKPRTRRRRRRPPTCLDDSHDYPSDMDEFLDMAKRVIHEEKDDDDDDDDDDNSSLRAESTESFRDLEQRLQLYSPEDEVQTSETGEDSFFASNWSSSASSSFSSTPSNSPGRRYKASKMSPSKECLAAEDSTLVNILGKAPADFESKARTVKEAVSEDGSSKENIQPNQQQQQQQPRYRIQEEESKGSSSSLKPDLAASYGSSDDVYSTTTEEGKSLLSYEDSVNQTSYSTATSSLQTLQRQISKRVKKKFEVRWDDNSIVSENSWGSIDSLGISRRPLFIDTTKRRHCPSPQENQKENEETKEIVSASIMGSSSEGVSAIQEKEMDTRTKAEEVTLNTDPTDALDTNGEMAPNYAHIPTDPPSKPVIRNFFRPQRRPSLSVTPIDPPDQLAGEKMDPATDRSEFAEEELEDGRPDPSIISETNLTTNRAVNSGQVIEEKIDDLTESTSLDSTQDRLQNLQTVELESGEQSTTLLSEREGTSTSPPRPVTNASSSSRSSEGNLSRESDWSQILHVSFEELLETAPMGLARIEEDSAVDTPNISIDDAEISDNILKLMISSSSVDNLKLSRHVYCHNETCETSLSIDHMLDNFIADKVERLNELLQERQDIIARRANVFKELQGKASSHRPDSQHKSFSHPPPSNDAPDQWQPSVTFQKVQHGRSLLHKVRRRREAIANARRRETEAQDSRSLRSEDDSQGASRGSLSTLSRLQESERSTCLGAIQRDQDLSNLQYEEAGDTVFPSQIAYKATNTARTPRTSCSSSYSSQPQDTNNALKIKSRRAGSDMKEKARRVAALRSQKNKSLQESMDSGTASEETMRTGSLSRSLFPGIGIAPSHASFCAVE